MVAEGRIYRQRKGRYATPESLNLATGRLQVKRSGDAFVVTATDREDVFVRADLRATAVDGDTVVARIERRRPGRRPEGRVIRVLRRAVERVVGVYHARRGYGFVVPREPALVGTEFFVPRDVAAKADDGDLVVVEVVDWGEGEPSPVGQVVKILGRPEDPGLDVLAILIGHQLPSDFPPEVEAAAETVAAAGLDPRALEGREDLRDRLAFTIDPSDAADHDDALSLRPIGRGRFEVGVHIADVSTYVAEGGVLDEEARQRGTSVYLVDRVVPMLPARLSADLCSLRPEEDRLTMSLLFELDEAGETHRTRLVRAVIRSRHRLSYDEAEKILDGGAGPAELVEPLDRLRRIARKIRARREERGSIDFDLPEARVILNSAGEPTDVQRVLRLSSHCLVEDFMIFANEAVAELAIREKLPAIFRVHEEPSEEKLEALRALAATFGLRLPRGKVRPRQVAKLITAAKGTAHETLLATVALRSMQRAKYSSRNLGHFGLASTAYAHFTSPIRRYPDLIVHRQLHRWLDDRRRARKTATELMEEIAIHSTERERKATEAERDSVELKSIEFMERHLGDEFEGTISGVTAFGLFVLLDAYQVEGLVHVSGLDDDYYQHDEERHALVGRRRGRRFRLGDRVKVTVARTDREARQIDFDLV